MPSLEVYRTLGKATTPAPSVKWRRRSSIAPIPSFRRNRLQSLNLPTSKTVWGMIVHQADRLHVRVHDCGPDEPESAPLEIFAQRVGFRRRRGDARCLPVIDLWPSADEPPTIRVEA